MATTAQVVISRTRKLSLYRKLLRQGSDFSSFNFRKYVDRRVRDGFKANIDLEDPGKIEEAYQKGFKALGMLKRQAKISSMYSAPKIIVEKPEED